MELEKWLSSSEHSLLLPRIWVQVPKLTRHLTAIRNYNPRGSNAFSWRLRVLMRYTNILEGRTPMYI